MLLKGTPGRAFSRLCRRRPPAWTLTRVCLNDTIGPSSVAATGITTDLGTLVTTQYGHPACWVHVLHRRLRDQPETKASSKRSRRSRGTGPPATMRHNALQFTRPSG